MNIEAFLSEIFSLIVSKDIAYLLPDEYFRKNHYLKELNKKRKSIREELMKKYKIEKDVFDACMEILLELIIANNFLLEYIYFLLKEKKNEVVDDVFKVLSSYISISPYLKDQALPAFVAYRKFLDDVLELFVSVRELVTNKNFNSYLNLTYKKDVLEHSFLTSFDTYLKLADTYLYSMLYLSDNMPSRRFDKIFEKECSKTSERLKELVKRKPEVEPLLFLIKGKLKGKRVVFVIDTIDALVFMSKESKNTNSLNLHVFGFKYKDKE